MVFLRCCSQFYVLYQLEAPAIFGLYLPLICRYIYGILVLKLYRKGCNVIITVGGSKGGTGKSTIACHLAVLRATSGKKVLLVDADEQQSAKLFSTQRKLQYAQYPQYHADTHLDDAVRLEVSQRRGD